MQNAELQQYIHLKGQDIKRTGNVISNVKALRLSPFSRARSSHLVHRSLRSSVSVIDHYRSGAPGRGVQSSSPVGRDLWKNAGDCAVDRGCWGEHCEATGLKLGLRHLHTKLHFNARHQIAFLILLKFLFFLSFFSSLFFSQTLKPS